MKNALVMYFDNELSDIIRILKKDRVCNIVDWVGESEDCTINFRKNLKYECFHYDGYKKYDNEIYSKVHNEFFNYFIFQNRLNKIYNKYYKFYDHLDFFNMYFQIFFSIFKEKKIDLLILQNIPHLGIDFLAYNIAKCLNVRTIMFSQSLFPNRFFYFEDVNDFGVFHTIKTIFTDDFKIEKKFKKDLFYMQSKPNLKNLNGKFIVKQFKIYVNQLKRASYGKRFKLNLNRAISSNFDLQKKFVYFPLHLQPELTTSILGGIYIDQALALERLSELLPTDWYIYVKENPKQNTEYMRGVGFFKRLQGIHNLKIVPTRTDTYLLMEKSQFVATITGTAGWEAITGGKNVLIFGNAWYKQLPGVFLYHEKFDINTLINYRIDHAELQKSVSVILNKMPYGVIDSDYSVIVKNFSVKQNCLTVANFIEQIIN